MKVVYLSRTPDVGTLLADLSRLEKKEQGSGKLPEPIQQPEQLDLTLLQKYGIGILNCEICHGGMCINAQTCKYAQLCSK